jgi:hypothetical protein
MKYRFGTIPLCPGAAQPAYILDAKQDVLMQGHARHFINGDQGLTWACALSNMAKDPENRSAFPHPLREMFFTSRTGAYGMTGEKYKGFFVYIKYAHNYGIQLDMNDTKIAQKMAKETPEVFEQKFLLRIPAPKKKRILKTQAGKRTSGPRKPQYSARGATARAVTAGIMSYAEARGMVRSMDAYERQRLSSVKKRTGA